MKKVLVWGFILKVMLVDGLIAQPTFKTGINFPLRGTEVGSIDLFMQKMHETGTPAMRQMTYGDVFWKNVEKTNNAWTFTTADSTYKNIYGITPVGTFYSIMGGDTIGFQVPWRACTDPRTCFWDAARDSTDSKDYVTQTVNRYKGITKYWEVGNEIDNKKPPSGFANPVQTRNFLSYNYRWIKQADPTAQVLFPGLLGTYGYPQSSSFTWLRQMLAAGAGTTFDIMNYHDYNSWWTLPAHYDSVKTIMSAYGLSNRPIWITETSISSLNRSTITPAYSSTDEQAADVWRRLTLLWSKGAQVVFWHANWSSGGGNSWEEFGLISNSGVKKKSYHAYTLLVEKIASFSEVKILQYGTVTDNNTSGGDGRWAIEFKVKGAPKWVLWSPNRQSYTLSGISTNRIIVTRVVPTQVSTNGEIASFQRDTLEVTAGSYTFNQLTSLPVLVEPYQETVASNTRLRWDIEAGVRLSNTTSSSAIPLPNGSYRAYLPGARYTDAMDGFSFASTKPITLIPALKTGELFSNVAVITQLNGTYLMLFELSNSSNPNQRSFHRAVSTDGLTFYRYPADKPVLSAQSGDNNFLGVPDLIWVNPEKTQLRLYFVAGGNFIETALSTDQGLTWTREGKITINGISSIQQVDPDILRFGNKYMLLFAHRNQTDLNLRIRSATSVDGKTFEVDPLESVSVDNTSQLRLDPDVILLPDGRYRMFFGEATSAQANDFQLRSAISRVETIPPPDKPMLVQPQNNAGGLSAPLSLQWQTTSNTSTYLVQVGDTLSFTPSVPAGKRSGVVFQANVNQVVGSLASYTLPPFTTAHPAQFFWRVRSTGAGGTGAWSEVWRFTRAKLGTSLSDQTLPSRFFVYPNYPNPFNPTTTLVFDLPISEQVFVGIYNVQGQKVMELVSGQYFAAGTHQLQMDATTLGSGMYLYRVRAGRFEQTGKMMVLK